jgi:hypothetical protein
MSIISKGTAPPYLQQHTTGAVMPLTLTPAYGRDYKSAKAVKEDWEANKDFIIDMGPYDGMSVNKQDAPKGIYHICYNKLTQICAIMAK